jgi:hypothetical protein
VTSLPRTAAAPPIIPRLIVEDQPYTFLAETERLVAINARVRGAVINDASPYFNLEEWYVELAGPK